MTRLLKALIVGLLLLGCQKAQESKDGQTRPRVTCLPLRLKEWENRVVISATAIPKATVQVVAKVPGRIKEVKADEGDEVRLGDPLLVLDTRDLALAKRQAEAQVLVSKAALEAAEVQRETLEKDLLRFSDLSSRGSVTKGELDKVKAAFDAQVAQVKVAKAQLKAAETALAQATLALKDAVVRAPIDGIVIKRNVDVGQETSPLASGPLMVLAQVDPIFLEGQVPETFFGSIREGLEARVRLDGLQGATFSGKVVLVGPSVDPATKMFRVRVSLSNPKGEGGRRIVPGMSGIIEVTGDKGRYFVIPMNAVRRQEGKDLYVFIVGEDHKVLERKVTPIRKEGLYFLALEGLKEGELLVTSGPKELKEGQVVEVVVSE